MRKFSSKLKFENFRAFNLKKVTFPLGKMKRGSGRKITHKISFPLQNESLNLYILLLTIRNYLSLHFAKIPDWIGFGFHWSEWVCYFLFPFCHSVRRSRCSRSGAKKKVMSWFRLWNWSEAEDEPGMCIAKNIINYVMGSQRIGRHRLISFHTFIPTLASSSSSWTRHTALKTIVNHK